MWKFPYSEKAVCVTRTDMVSWYLTEWKESREELGRDTMISTERGKSQALFSVV